MNFIICFIFNQLSSSSGFSTCMLSQTAVVGSMLPAVKRSSYMPNCNNWCGETGEKREHFCMQWSRAFTSNTGLRARVLNLLKLFPLPYGRPMLYSVIKLSELLVYPPLLSGGQRHGPPLGLISKLCWGQQDSAHRIKSQRG